MHSSDVRKWIDSYDRAHRKEDAGRRELDRLAMLSQDEELECDSGQSGRWNRGTAAWEESPSSKPAESTMRLALLFGAATIAALAIFFG